MTTINQLPATSNQATCENCRFSKHVSGLKAPTLICNHKPDTQAKFHVVDPAGVCPNFDNCGHTPPEIAEALAEGARLLELSQGKVAIVDAEDYERLTRYKWHIIKTTATCYGARSIKHRKKGQEIYMHRLIIKVPPGLFVDHIDHNGLNNRKSNLRLCTAQQNAQNHRPQRGATSKYKGVSFSKSKNLFRAMIWHNKKSVHLGYFKCEIDAAKTYDKKAKELFKEYAYLNFPDK